MKLNKNLVHIGLVLVTSLLLGSLFSGCTAGKNAIDLDGTSWVLIKIDDTVLSHDRGTLIFKDGKVGGNATCNSFFGPYESEGTSLKFGMLGATMMACIDMSEETACLSALESVTAYRIDGEQLVLLNDNKDAVLTYKPMEHTALEGTQWQMTNVNTGTGLASALSDVEVTAEFADGQVTGSAGCNQYFGEAKIDGEQLSMGMVGSTEMWCEGVEGQMEQETTYLDALTRAATFKIERTVLTLYDTDGTRVLVFKAVEE